jgi:hypothetical protein
MHTKPEGVGLGSPLEHIAQREARHFPQANGLTHNLVCQDQGELYYY